MGTMTAVTDDVITVEEQRTHIRRVETLCGVMRDLLLAASTVPPFSMMVTPEQIAELKSL